jgi:general secretion pathway protein G
LTAARRAFSLVEIMIVIVIIGLLAAAVSLNVRTYIDKAKVNTAKAEIATICGALQTFYGEYGRYPTNDEGLDILTKPNEKFPQKLLTGKPIDPWGRPYQYLMPGREDAYEVFSLGADGKEGGTGADADINSSQLKDTSR